MGEFSLWHWLIVLMVVLLLFGGGRVSGLMGELAKGIKAFKQTMSDDDRAAVKDSGSGSGTISGTDPAKPIGETAKVREPVDPA